MFSLIFKNRIKICIFLVFLKFIYLFSDRKTRGQLTNLIFLLETRIKKEQNEINKKWIIITLSSKTYQPWAVHFQLHNCDKTWCYECLSAYHNPTYIYFKPTGNNLYIKCICSLDMRCSKGNYCSKLHLLNDTHPGSECINLRLCSRCIDPRIWLHRWSQTISVRSC